MSQNQELEVVKPGETYLPSFQDDTPKELQAQFDAMSRAGFLPRLSLMAGTSDLVTEGKMSVGKYAMIRGQDDFVDLGDSFDCVPLCWRLVAMNFGDPIVIEYAKPDGTIGDEFRAIQVESGEKDSRCGYGPQFLVWIPKLKEFATYFFGSKSARPEGRKVNQLLGKGATFRKKLIDNGTNKWWVPQVVPCQTELLFPTPEMAQASVDAYKALKSSSEKENAVVSDDATTAAGEEARAR